MTIYIVVLSPVSRPMPALPFKRLHAEWGGGGGLGTRVSCAVQTHTKLGQKLSMGANNCDCLKIEVC